MDWDYLPQVWYFFDAIPIPEFSAQPWYLSSPPPPLPDALKLRSVFEGKIFGLIFRRRRKENGEQEEGRGECADYRGGGREGGREGTMGWLAVWMLVATRVRAWARIKVPSIHRSHGSLERETGEALRGWMRLTGAGRGAACQGSGVANKEIFCFADANLGEVLKMVGQGRGTTMMVL